MIRQEYDLLRCNYTVEETETYLREVVNSQYAGNASRIFDALAVAKKAHMSQLRDDYVPFIFHPMRVALMLAKYDNSTTSKVIVAALLHDLLEKTTMTPGLIEEQFGQYVSKLVSSITKNCCESQSCDGQSIQDREKAKLQQWQEIMQSSHEVRAIKTFEDLDNMICWKAIPQESPARKKIPGWLREAKEMSLPLAQATNVQAYLYMKEEYARYVEQGFAED